MLCRDNDGLVMENKCNILRYIIDMQLMRFGGVRQHAITNYFSHRIKYMTLFSLNTLAEFSFHYHFFSEKINILDFCKYFFVLRFEVRR